MLVMPCYRQGGGLNRNGAEDAARRLAIEAFAIALSLCCCLIGLFLGVELHRELDGAHAGGSELLVPCVQVVAAELSPLALNCVCHVLSSVMPGEPGRLDFLDAPVSKRI
ncbi:hypothetical protein IDZ91_07600 [Pseudomonas aeruginosa]|uniref:hypothetical protein n=1 Tax=Pseudomonas aeruginosa TaxID=287 RepID=UPI00156BA76B|nr:hypothetical protein [Pseudomonas aeruginosa]MBO8383591.1 hypothetical protein [Pseudomonas aeruginosa]MCV6287721.1 hypothetical protein [Pseudomonas aeruginosa]NRS63913.1 hypothetical protein [Pseudomonas aeruginosa]HCF4081416.1 hypothetical protein [Pseudomonas aeruginosa]HCI2847551.1 hypothetical protein [Pseudomonas aeruginosa]